MQKAAVIPYYDIEWSPFVVMNIVFLCDMAHQRIYKFVAVILIHSFYADDRPNDPWCYMQRLRTGLVMPLDQRVNEIRRIASFSVPHEYPARLGITSVG